MQLRAVRKSSLSPADQDLIDQHHCLRSRVFSERLGWSVDVRDGREADEYDGLDPTYILAATDDGRVAGCARLLPATGPTMLARTFPQLLGGSRLVAHSAMVESSRFCVDTSLQEGRGGGTLHDVTFFLFAGILEWSMSNGYREIVTATDLRFERILKRAGWPMTRLGEPCRIGNTVAVAGVLPTDLASFHRVCPASYRSPTLSASRQAA